MILDMDELTPNRYGPVAPGRCLKYVHVCTLCVPKQFASADALFCSHLVFLVHKIVHMKFVLFPNYFII